MKSLAQVQGPFHMASVLPQAIHQSPLNGGIGAIGAIGGSSMATDRVTFQHIEPIHSMEKRGKIYLALTLGVKGERGEMGVT